MDAVPVHRGAPRYLYQYVKGHGAQGSAKTDRGALFEKWWRRSGGMSFCPTSENSCLEILKSVCLHLLPFLRCFLDFKKENAHLYFPLFLDSRYYWMKSFRSFQESCGKDQVFTSELKSYYIVHFYQLMLDLKQCDLVGTPYLNAQISDSSDL